MGKKLTFEYVKSYFEKEGCVLLDSNYVNSQVLVSYVCNCGNKSKIRFHDFKRGRRCQRCKGRKHSETFRHDYEYVKSVFQKGGCALLEQNYTNSKILLSYICKCGKESKISFLKFKQGRRCAKCGGTEKLTFEYVKSFFEEEGCELLESAYKNNKAKMSYICECGNKAKISFGHFQNGKRCRFCKNKSKGEEEIAIILDKMQLKFERQKRFKTCKDKCHLLFDFMVKVNDNIGFLIEYNGIQHYEAVRRSKSVNDEQLLEGFNSTKRRDNIKQEWAKRRNIPLLIIPYWDKDNMSNIIEQFVQDLTENKNAI